MSLIIATIFRHWRLNLKEFISWCCLFLAQWVFLALLIASKISNKNWYELQAKVTSSAFLFGLTFFSVLNSKKKINKCTIWATVLNWVFEKYDALKKHHHQASWSNSSFGTNWADFCLFFLSSKLYQQNVAKYTENILYKSSKWWLCYLTIFGLWTHNARSVK